MNKYEARAEEQRRAALRSSMSVWTAGLLLIVIVLTILYLNGSAPAGFMPKAAIAVAIVLLLLRQLARRLRNRGPRVQPDPRSRLKLD